MSDLRLSATSIRDYLNCPRRFQLRYILQQPWPAAENEPLLEHERSRERGAQFHRLIERYYLGVDARTLSNMIADPIVRGWWQVHQSQSPIDIRATKQVLPEKMFQAKLDNYVLTAFIDLIVIGQDDSVTIVDWKTVRRAPDPQEWSESVQTLVYLYVVGEKMQADGIPLSKIKMLYWFVEYPDQPVWIHYGDEQHQQAKSKLRDLLKSVRDETDWPKTPDLKKCKFCVYRSLCDRGIHAENPDNFEEPETWTLLADADPNE